MIRLQASMVGKFTPPVPKTYSWQDLCGNVRRGDVDITQLLEQYSALDTDSRALALALRTAYCQLRRLSVLDLVRGNGALSIAYLCEGASLEACSCLAALIARCTEQGAAR